VQQKLNLTITNYHRIISKLNNSLPVPAYCTAADIKLVWMLICYPHIVYKTYEMMIFDLLIKA